MALGLAENWTKLMRWPMASSMLPAQNHDPNVSALTTDYTDTGGRKFKLEHV